MTDWALIDCSRLLVLMCVGIDIGSLRFLGLYVQLSIPVTAFGDHVEETLFFKRPAAPSRDIVFGFRSGGWAPARAE